MTRGVPRGGPPHAASTMAASAARAIPPKFCGTAKARGHESTEPAIRHTRIVSSGRLGGSPSRACCTQPPFPGEFAPTYASPAEMAIGAHTVETVQVMVHSERGQRRTTRCKSGARLVPDARASEFYFVCPVARHPLPSSHKTTDRICGSRTPPQVRVPLFPNFRPNLYGKSKKSTHGHTNVKPFGPTFLQVVFRFISFARRVD